MIKAFIFKLGFKIQKTNIKIPKINDTTLEIYKMMVSSFSILDKNNRKRFFEKSFLLANVKPDIMLEIHFLTMSNANVDFQA